MAVPASGSPARSAILDSFRERARQQQQRIFFPEQSDSRVQHAMRAIAEQRICQPVIFKAGPGDEYCEVFRDSGHSDDWIERAVAAYASKMQAKGLSVDDARKQLRDPLLLATVLVSIGFVDSGVAGSLASTADVLRACLRGIGLAADSQLVSSVFVMDHHHRLMTFGDCAVNPSPDAAQLAQIAIDSAATHQVLTGHKALVALLSFSTHGSAEHAEVDKVRAALEIIRRRAPNLLVCGELQLDAAIIAEVGTAKAKDSAVAGKANVLIFPDLNSGNIAYKIAERLGGAHAIGPVLQGLAKPWIDLSRGCTTHDIVNAATIASLLATASTHSGNHWASGGDGK